MAPLPPESTKRFYYNYANATNPHTFVFRVPDDATTAGTDALVATILGAIGGSFPLSTITSVEVSATGSNARFPIASDRIGDSFGSGVGSVEQDAIGIGFVGRSSGGHRARLFLFDWGGGFSSNYRIAFAESTAVATVIDALNGATGVIEGIDGLEVTWKAYANVKPNDHWVKAGRS